MQKSKDFVKAKNEELAKTLPPQKIPDDQVGQYNKVLSQATSKHSVPEAPAMPLVSIALSAVSGGESTRNNRNGSIRIILCRWE